MKKIKLYAIFLAITGTFAIINGSEGSWQDPEENLAETEEALDRASKAAGDAAESVISKAITPVNPKLNKLIDTILKNKNLIHRNASFSGLIATLDNKGKQEIYSYLKELQKKEEARYRQIDVGDPERNEVSTKLKTIESFIAKVHPKK